MSLNAFPVLSNEPELVAHVVRLQGAGAADFTVDVGGSGMSVARDGAGVHTITWSDNPGVFIGWSWSIGAATPTDVDGYSIVREAYSSSAYTMQFNVLTEGQAAHDLSTSEWIDLVIYFKRTSA